MDWQALKESLLAAWNVLAAYLAGFLPRLALGFLVLVIGYLIARLVRRAMTGLLSRTGFDKLSSKAGIDRTVARSGLGEGASQLIGSIAFWIVFLLFLITGVQVLELDALSRPINAFLLYLPNVLGAALLLVVGLGVAHLARRLVRQGAESLGIESADLLAKAVYAFLAVIIVVLALGQLQIETALLIEVIRIVLLAAALTLAVALGLGSRGIARNLISGIYARDLHRPGQTIRIGEEQGTLLEVGTVTTTLETEGGGKVYIPNTQVVEQIVRGAAGSPDGR